MDMLGLSVIVSAAIAIYAVMGWLNRRAEKREERLAIRHYFANAGDFMSDFDLETEYRRRVSQDPTGFAKRVASKQSSAPSLAAAVLVERRRVVRNSPSVAQANGASVFARGLGSDDEYMRGVARGGGHATTFAFDQQAKFSSSDDTLSASDNRSHHHWESDDRLGRHVGLMDDDMSRGLIYSPIYSPAAAAMGYPNGMGSSEGTSTPITDQYYQSLSRHDP